MTEWRGRNPEKDKNNRLRAKFNITFAEYADALASQGNACAVCQLPCRTGKRLAVDHNHACCPGKKSCGRCVRGLLCEACNHGIGKMGDDPERLRRAAEYIEQHHERTYPRAA